jgi:RNA polymerase sigma-70 factor (ECF subfamily)
LAVVGISVDEGGVTRFSLSIHSLSAPSAAMLTGISNSQHPGKDIDGLEHLRPENQPVQGPAGAGLNPERWVDEYGDILFGFAAARVRNRALAQDLVQETFLAAIKASKGFAGRSTERSWLFGILRNKLVDHYRLQKREAAFTDSDPFLPEEQGAFSESRLGRDGWVMKHAPKPWQTPDGTLVSKEFQTAFKGCLSRLPDKVALSFVLREVDGIPPEEICKVLGVSPNNLWVMLHRARMGLRRCLEMSWFENK